MVAAVAAVRTPRFSSTGASLKTLVHPLTDEFVLIGKLVGRVAGHHAEGFAIEFVGLGEESPTAGHLYAEINVAL